MQNAVNTIANSQLIFLRFKVNVRRAILERFPNNLVYELDDARFLIALGDFLVVSEIEIHRVAFAHFIERFRADAVIFFQRLFDFAARRERKTHRHFCVKANRIHHRRVKRIADGNLQNAIINRDRQNEILKRNLRGKFAAHFVFNREFRQFQIRPAERGCELLNKNIFGHAAFARDERQQRLGGTGVRRRAPRLAPIVELRRRRFRDRRNEISDWAKGHLG